jgi:hypothetical protein
MLRHQNVGQNHNERIANKSFQNGEDFVQLLGQDKGNQNYIDEEIKSRLQSGNSYCRSDENYFSLSACCLKP